jgi:hypothetical protein
MNDIMGTLKLIGYGVLVVAVNLAFWVGVGVIVMALLV